MCKRDNGRSGVRTKPHTPCTSRRRCFAPDALPRTIFDFRSLPVLLCVCPPPSLPSCPTTCRPRLCRWVLEYGFAPSDEDISRHCTALHLTPRDVARALASLLPASSSSSSAAAAGSGSCAGESGSCSAVGEGGAPLDEAALERLVADNLEAAGLPAWAASDVRLPSMLEQSEEGGRVQNVRSWWGQAGGGRGVGGGGGGSCWGPYAAMRGDVFSPMVGPAPRPRNLHALAPARMRTQT